jgi:hypothetical protein
LAYRSFGREYRERSGFIMWMLLINTVMLSGYVFIGYSGPDPQLFWFVGMGLTGLVAVICAAVMFAVVRSDRRARREKAVRDPGWRERQPVAEPSGAEDREKVIQAMRGASARRADLPPIGGRGAKLARR